jgi:hypothetical protein
MSVPNLSKVSEGGFSDGRRWTITAGGTSEDFYTFVDIVNADGREEGGGGFGGPIVQTGSLVNSYVGRRDDGPVYILFRAIPLVAALHLVIAGQTIELRPLGIDKEFGTVFFLWIGSADDYPTALTALGAEDQILEEQRIRRPRLFS